MKLVESLGDIIPSGTDQIDSYLNPLFRYMTDGWKEFKLWLYERLMLGARRSIKKTELTEADKDNSFSFSQSEIKKIMSDMGMNLDAYVNNVKEMIDKIKERAKIDASPLMHIVRGQLITISPSTPIGITLDRQGLQKVLDALDNQIQYIDDLNASIRDRIDNLIHTRYNSISAFETIARQELRIDRESLITTFKNSVTGIADNVISGNITSHDFVSKMQAAIEDHYRKLYLAGRGDPTGTLTVFERELIKKQVDSQTPYLTQFRNYIDQKIAAGDELTGRIRWRSGLYAERGSAIYELGYYNSLADDALIDWVLNPAEHCKDCPVLARNSPYTKTTLPGFPGEGFTECLTNCKCNLQEHAVKSVIPS